MKIIIECIIVSAMLAINICILLLGVHYIESNFCACILTIITLLLYRKQIFLFYTLYPRSLDLDLEVLESVDQARVGGWGGCSWEGHVPPG